MLCTLQYRLKQFLVLWFISDKIEQCVNSKENITLTLTTVRPHPACLAVTGPCHGVAVRPIITVTEECTVGPILPSLAL